MSLAFYHVRDTRHIRGLNWRLMLGSAGVQALSVLAQVYFLPESPRWLMKKKRYHEAMKSLLRLRNSRLQAARDLYYIHVLLTEEEAVIRNRNLFLELFTVPRNRRARLASFIVLFIQQFCGVNVIAYYSSTIFRLGGLSVISSLLGSWGFGMVNFVFALPAVCLIVPSWWWQLLLLTVSRIGVFFHITGFSVVVDPF